MKKVITAIIAVIIATVIISGLSGCGEYSINVTGSQSGSSAQASESGLVVNHDSGSAAESGQADVIGDLLDIDVEEVTLLEHRRIPNGSGSSSWWSCCLLFDVDASAAARELLSWRVAPVSEGAEAEKLNVYTLTLRDGSVCSVSLGGELLIDGKPTGFTADLSGEAPRFSDDIPSTYAYVIPSATGGEPSYEGYANRDAFAQTCRAYSAYRHYWEYLRGALNDDDCSDMRIDIERDGTSGVMAYSAVIYAKNTAAAEALIAAFDGDKLPTEILPAKYSRREMNAVIEMFISALGISGDSDSPEFAIFGDTIYITAYGDLTQEQVETIEAVKASAGMGENIVFTPDAVANPD